MPHGLARPAERAEIYADAAALSESLPLESDAAAVPATIRGGRERGLIVHKLLEEVLTGETPDQLEMLETRARALLAQLGVTEAARSEDGPHAPELAATVLRALAIPEISACRSRLIPELTVFSVQSNADGATYTGGVVDALAHHADGSIALIIDWKTDVDPSLQQIELYRDQVRDYLDATSASEGLLVFVTTGQLVRVRRAYRPTVNAA
jgi:ATP-dependent exoDNAse (exonuclease V) beta subunit